MANQVNNLYVTNFDKLIKQEYSAKIKLRKMVRVKKKVEGSEIRFQLLDQAIASQKTRLGDVKAMDPNFYSVKTPLSDWHAALYTEIFDKPKLNFDEKQELTKVSGRAIARREDQIIIDAFKNSTTKLTTFSWPDYIADLEHATEFFRDLSEAFNYRNIPDDDRYFLISPHSLHQLLKDDRAITFDSNTVKALVEGKMAKWLGINILVLGYMPEGGLPVRKDFPITWEEVYADTNEIVGLAWHKSSLGLGVGKEMKTEINYIPEKTSYLINTLYSAGSCIIDHRGAFLVTTQGLKPTYPA